MKRCVIIGAAEIDNYEYVRGHLGEDDFYIFCDAGLKHAGALGAMPNLIVGDFDSFGNIKNNDGTSVPTEISEQYPDAEILTLPHIKDDTDTVFAAKEAMRRGFCEYLLIGVIGNRLDHTFANISILVKLAKSGCKAIAVDDYSEMEVLCGAGYLDGVDDSAIGAPAITSVGPEFSYFSIICLSDKLSGVTIENAFYNLANAEITPEYQFATSNESLDGETVHITIGSGIALVIRVK